MSDSRPDVSLSERAVGQLDDLGPETAGRILSKLEDVTWNPEHYLRPLSGCEGYRLRVGDYQVIVDWRRDDGEIFVREVGHRRNVYD
jgi:mRNA interferase RelE/StbE